MYGCRTLPSPCKRGGGSHQSGPHISLTLCVTACCCEWLTVPPPFTHTLTHTRSRSTRCFLAAFTMLCTPPSGSR
jgi:hypothetical protein